MAKNKPPRDCIRAYQRQATASRRVRANQKCATCGETRPEALIAGSKPTVCAACQRKKRGRSALDAHHVAGQSNSAVTIAVPVNDHRAILSPAQYDWPKETLENPDASPLLAAAAHIRGFIDTIYYLIDKLLAWIPEFLEALHASLTKRLGLKWWRKTELEKFAPKRKSNVRR
jgi:hypothetical protein